METTIPNSSNLAMNWGYMGIMEKKMETNIVYRECIGIMEKKMETTIPNSSNLAMNWG